MQIVPLHFKSSGENLYIQLFNHLKEQILSGAIPAHTKLPPIRTYAQTLKVNNSTVIQAYKQLEMTGYIEAKRGSGYYVLPTKETAPVHSVSTPSTLPVVADFSSASPHPAIFPTQTFKEYLVEVINRDQGFAFGYQEANGFLPLRQQLATFLADYYNLHTHADVIQIVSGAQQGLNIIAKSCLHTGDTVALETPTYSGALAVFQSIGCRTMPISLTDIGINLVELEKKVRIAKPKLLYIMPHYQIPTTICYSKETMLALLALAHTYDFYIVEEDSMSELSYTGTKRTLLKSLDQADRVIYLKSFSKLLMPGLRMGFLIIPQKLLPKFIHTKQTTDISSSGLIQRALELYFSNHKWEEHVRYMLEIYQAKYEYMLLQLSALQTYGISFSIPQGGLSFWLTLPPHLSAKKIVAACQQRGVLLTAGNAFYPSLAKEKDNHLRISYASCTTTELKEGMKSLLAILEDSI